MISAGLAAAILVTSVVLTYFCCLRPMRRGRCAMGPRIPAAAGATQASEVQQLREEIAVLQRQAGQ